MTEFGLRVRAVLHKEEDLTDLEIARVKLIVANGFYRDKDEIQKVEKYIKEKFN